MTDKVRSANDDWIAEGAKLPPIRKAVGRRRTRAKVRPYRRTSLRWVLRTVLLAVLDMTAFVVSLLVAAFMVPSGHRRITGVPHAGPQEDPMQGARWTPCGIQDHFKMGDMAPTPNEL